MKKFYLMTVMMALLVGSISLQARNKPQIFFKNEYGQDVAVALTWKNRNFPYDVKDSALTLHENAHNVMIKAPISTYDLHSVSVTPLKNLDRKNRETMILEPIGILGGAGMGTGASLMTMGATLNPAGAAIATAGIVVASAVVITEIALDIHNGKNVDSIKNVHSHKYFVIEAMSKNSHVKGQKQIRLKEYKSVDHYNREVVKQDSKVGVQQGYAHDQVEAVMLVDLAPEETDEQDVQVQSLKTAFVE